jgi:hypothetical protein
MVRRLLFLLGLAVVCVVWNHASGWGFVSMFWWTDRYLPVSVPNFDQVGCASYYMLRVITQLIIFAIPCFLFVSGFFVAFATGRNQTNVSWKVILTRVNDLLIPYLLWSCIMIVTQVILGYHLTLGRFIHILLTGQATEAFYFIPVLIQLYLLAPLLVPLVRVRWKLALFLSGVFQVFILCLRYAKILGLDANVLQPLYYLTRFWLFTGFLFWFLFGIIFGFHSGEIKPVFIRFRWAALFGLVIAFLAGIFEWEALFHASGEGWIYLQETLIDQIYAGLFLITFLGFENVALPWMKTISHLGTRSFGVYLAHGLALIITSQLIYTFAPALLGMQWLFQPILIAAGLGIPLLLMEITTRLPVRRYYSLIFG